MVFLKNLRNAQENTYARVYFLIKLQTSTLLKKRLWHGCESVNFVNLAKFVITPFSENTCGG